MKHKIRLFLILFIVVSMPIISIKAVDKTIQFEATMNLEHQEIVAGEKNHLDLAFKVTGAKTVLNNFSAHLVFGQEFEIDTSVLQTIPDVFKFELMNHELVLSSDQLEAGKFYKIPIMFNSKNGMIANDHPEMISFKVSADNMETQVFQKSVTIHASSPLKINKDYTGIYDEILNGSQGISPNMLGRWETRAEIHKKDYGQMFIKEGSVIRIEETFSEYLDFVEVLEGPEPDLIESNKLTWFFSAPSYQKQQEALDYLFFKDYTVIYKVKDITVEDKIEGVGAKTSLFFENIAHEILFDEDHALTNIYPSQVDTPEVKGNWWVPGHFGPSDAFSQHSIDFATMNTRPTVFPWASLQFAHQIASYEYGQNYRFDEYEINYYVNEHLDLKSLKTPGEFGYRPNREYGDATPLFEQPILDLRVYDEKGQELAYFANIKQNQVITKAEILAQNNEPKSTHIKHIQYRFVKTVPGMIVDEPDDIGPGNVTQLPTYQFGILPSWKNDAVNNVYELANEMDVRTVIRLSDGSPVTEIYDFKKGAEDRDFIRIYEDGTIQDEPEGFHFLSSPRWANVTEDETSYVPTVSNSISLLNHRDGLIYENENTLRVTLKNHDVGLGGVLENIESYLYIPRNIELDKIIQHSENNEAEFEKFEGMTLGNYQLYRVSWLNDQLAPGTSMEVDISVKVKASTEELTLYHFTDMINHHDYKTFKTQSENIVDSYKVALPSLLKSFSNSSHVVQTGNHYRMTTQEHLLVEKYVKAESDDEFKKTTTMKTHEELTYKLSITNRQKETIDRLVIMDVLPHPDDLGITDFVERNSDFSLVLTEALNIDENLFEVYYSEAKNPSRSMLNEAVHTDGFKLIEGDTEVLNWQRKNEIEDFTKISSFLIKLKEGETLAPNEKLDIVFTTEVKEPKVIDDILLSQQELWAHNSFALTVNGSPVVEPLQVSVKIENKQAVEIEKPTPPTPNDESKKKPFLPQTGKGPLVVNVSLALMILGLILKLFTNKSSKVS